MGIQVSSMEIRGSTLLKENRLPKFRSKETSLKMDSSGLLPEEQEKYGYETGRRVLPYLMQDVYTRDRSTVQVKTIVYENAFLKATFLPEYGMRLFSLWHKELKKEILYRNPVLQFANLAIRDAWFSGGIEWNIGQLGHTFTTCDSVYAGICRDHEGRKFLRCYEYERCKGFFWQVDFHLRENSDQLTAYVRCVNPRKEAMPFYWWTNIAVPEERNVRIFSGSPEVIYINTESLESVGAAKGMSHGRLPDLPCLPGRDASYPETFDFSSEYFFQNRRDPDQTWEAAVYDDGRVFYDYASERLQYHKLFCWGNRPGGRHWKDYLSEPEKGNYIELQAGFARTQVHGLDIPPETSWDFVQVFGETSMDPTLAQGPWDQARDQVSAAVRSRISPDKIQALLLSCRSCADSKTEELLHMGSGFGAVEQMRSPQSVPRGLCFPRAAIGERELLWVQLLQTRRIPDLPERQLPLSYMVDLRYEDFLREAAEHGGWTAANFYGVMCYENFRFEEAQHWFTHSLACKENPLACRNLFWCCRDQDPARAAAYMERAMDQLEEGSLREFAEEYIDFLTEQQQFQKAWDYYQALPRSLHSCDRINLSIIPAATAVEAVDFLQDQFSREHTAVREGERGFIECYFVYQAMLEAKETGAPLTDDLIRKYKVLNQVPYIIDFRQGLR